MDLFKTNEILVFTGSFIEVQALQNILIENNITSIVKDRFNSGMLAGFAASGLVQLFVSAVSSEQAKILVSDFRQAG